MHHHATLSHKMRFGAEVRQTGSRFALWGPKCRSVGLKLQRRKVIPMQRDDAGWHRVDVPGVGAGARYKNVIGCGKQIADPASRFQPAGVEGFSEVIAPELFRGRAPRWSGRPWEETILYQLHIGTFTPDGTWAAAMDRLDYLARLGFTAIELMPAAQSHGAFNWGYDGALWFAPYAPYGRPEDMKAFIDCSQALGLMVILDVVYNHFGAVGNALPELCPTFNHASGNAWGKAINLDGKGLADVRAFIIENALYWLTEFNLDGLRLDAVHVLVDDSNTHLLEILAARVRAAFPFRHVHLILEKKQNEEGWLRRDTRLNPVHYTAQWNDDPHHVLHAAVTGEVTGYYADYQTGTSASEDMGRALAERFVFQGQRMADGSPRGEESAGLPPTAFVINMQNHDQIGDRVHGDRIHRFAPPDAVTAFAATYLLCPQIRMLFMGEEFAAPTPFPFFADMPKTMHADMRKGRVAQLRDTPEEDDPEKPDADETDDPTDRKTFDLAKLDWSESEAGRGFETLNTYRALLDLRRREIVPRLAGISGFDACYARLGQDAVLVIWRMGDGATLRLYLNLSQTSQTGVPPIEGCQLWLSGYVGEGRLGPWTVLWTIEV
ncbi:malto-oligosyltrehalose trehalohydrolase [Pseudotabrizicola sediminis]